MVGVGSRGEGVEAVQGARRARSGHTGRDDSMIDHGTDVQRGLR